MIENKKKRIIWSYEMLISEGKKFSNKQDFRKVSGGAYSKAQKNGWLDEICSHMIGKNPYKNKNYWLVEENCKNEILKYQSIHGDRYDYSKTVFINTSTNIEIICKEHGSFFQRPYKHSVGQGCPVCSKSFKTSFNEQVIFYYLDKLGICVLNGSKFKKKEIDIFIPSMMIGIEYDGLYFHKDNFEKDNIKSKFLIENNIKLLRVREIGLSNIDICDNVIIENPTDYQNLEKVINFIIKFINSNSNNNYTIDIDINKDIVNISNFIQLKKLSKSLLNTHPNLVNEWHPTKNNKKSPINFSEGCADKIWWVCEKGHEYESRINSRTTIKNNGKSIGCPICAGNNRLNTNIFIKKSKKVHGDRYDYSKVNYINNLTKVEIICKKHGSFLTTPSIHMRGHNCLKCKIDNYSKIVLQYRLDGVFIKEWSSLRNIENVLGVDRGAIKKVCDGKKKYYKDNIWLYKNDEEIKLKINGVETIIYDEALLY